MIGKQTTPLAGSKPAPGVPRWTSLAKYRDQVSSRRRKAWINMVKSILLFIAGLAVGFGLGCGFFLLTSRSSPSQPVVQPIVQQVPQKRTVSVRSVQTLFDTIEYNPESVSAVLLTMTGSVVELKDGTRLYFDTLEGQPELQDAAVNAGLPWAIE